MKKLTNKTIILVMALAMVLTLAPAALASSAADDVDPENAVAYDSTLDTYYATLEDAMKEAIEGSIIILTKNYTLAAPITVDTGVELIIPTSDNWDDSEEGNNVNEEAPVEGVAHATLTVPSNLSVTVKGTLLVAGNQQGHRPKTGYLTGDFGKINLLGSLEVSGTLYARGEISGAGTVTAKAGSQIFQRFQIADWRGGTVALNSYRANAFPFSLYTLGGIESKTVYENGSKLLGQAYVYASGSGHSENVTYIGTSEADNSLIYFSGTTGDITFTTEKVENEVYTTATINADVTTDNLTFIIKIDFFGSTLEYPVSTAGLECPFGYHTDVVVSGTGSLDVQTKLKILPDCTLTVMTGGKVTIGTETSEDGKTTGGLYFYTAADYLPAFNGGNWEGTENATLVNNGTIKVNTYGVVACSNVNFPDVSGFVAEKNADDEYVTTPVIEYTSSAQTVTFYVGTPTTTAE